MPALFLPHGGGPWPWLPNMHDSHEELAVYLRTLPSMLPTTPTALLVISAHWEESVVTVMSSPRPGMLYDYYGFPDHTYQVQWPAPGATALAAEVESLLEGSGITTARDEERGFDHGAFVPLSLAFPEARIPTLQVSLRAGLDPAEHLHIGRALAPLRERGVLLVGSGMSYHNLRTLMHHLGGGPAPTEDSRAFDNWLAESVAHPADLRDATLVNWEQAPAARACHPREEHLIPLHVIAGAAGKASASLPFRGRVLGAHVSAVHFA